jgi:hypothetical protein
VAEVVIGRRGFLAGILAAGVAPAFVGSSVLMPVRRIILPTSGIDLIESLQFINDEVVRAFRIPPNVLELRTVKVSAIVAITEELLRTSAIDQISYARYVDQLCGPK